MSLLDGAVILSLILLVFVIFFCVPRWSYISGYIGASKRLYLADGKIPPMDEIRAEARQSWAEYKRSRKQRKGL